MGFAFGRCAFFAHIQGQGQQHDLTHDGGHRSHHRHHISGKSLSHKGKPLRNPIEGKYYDWPVGFNQGAQLKDYWQLEEHKLGETTFTHFADGTAHKNRMQGNDFAQSLMYSRGITCSTCHDVHGTPNNADLRKPPQQMCLTCHGVKHVNFAYSQ